MRQVIKEDRPDGSVTEIIIKSDGRERNLWHWFDLPEGTDQFDYIEDGERYDNRFFKFRGSWYDVHEFERAPDPYKSLGWDGASAQSYFDAVLIKLTDEFNDQLEGVVVGYAFW